MPELGTLGSVRGVASNGHPYRDKDSKYRAPTWSETRKATWTSALVRAAAQPVVSLLHGGLECRVGALRRYHSSDAEDFRLPELAHSVERFDRDGNLGRTSGVVA